MRSLSSFSLLYLSYFYFIYRYNLYFSLLSLYYLYLCYLYLAYLSNLSFYSLYIFYLAYLYSLSFYYLNFLYFSSFYLFSLSSLSKSISSIYSKSLPFLSFVLTTRLLSLFLVFYILKGFSSAYFGLLASSLLLKIIYPPTTPFISLLLPFSNPTIYSLVSSLI